MPATRRPRPPVLGCATTRILLAIVRRVYHLRTRSAMRHIAAKLLAAAAPPRIRWGRLARQWQRAAARRQEAAR